MYKDLNLKDRNIIVTGANGMIGKELMKCIRELNGNAIGIDREEDKNNGVLECNLEESDEIIDFCENKLRNLDVIHGLVNNAAFVGTSHLDGWNCDFENQSVETWGRCMDVNLKAPFVLTRQLAHKMRRMENNETSSIVNMASIYGLVGPQWDLYEGTNMSNPAAYSASKGGLIQLTRWLAPTLGPEIRVNSVTPGGIWRNHPKKFSDKYKKKTPLNRMGTEKDVTNACVFLLSEMSSYISGINLVVDGGWTAC